MKLTPYAAAVAALAVAALSLPAAASAQSVLSESFNNVAALAAAEWAQVNDSPNPSGSWFQGNTGVFNAASGPANSYVANNFTAGTPSISTWLMTPALTFGSGSAVSFSARSAGDSLLDTIQVYASLNGSSTVVSDFSILLGSYSSSVDAGWIAQSYNVSLVGSGRIGFRYVVANTETAGNYIGIDNVNVVPEPASALLALLGLAVVGRAATRCRSV